MMLPSRPSLWPSLVESAKDEERRQLAGYTCDYSSCSYLPGYEVHSTCPSAADEIHWRPASNLKANHPSTECCKVDSICFTYGDDLVWRDPNEISKKFERDSGVALWGDPDIVNARPVRNWLVGEGEEEDLETALVSRPISPNEDIDPNLEGHERGDFAREWPFVFPKPTARKVIPAGWIELPSRENQYFLRQGSNKFSTCSSPGSVDVFELLGQHTEFFTQHDGLSPSAAQFINLLHALIPMLRAVEMDLKHIVNQVESGVITEEQIARFLSQKEKVEYDRLVLGLAAMRGDIANLSRKMQSSKRSADAGNERLGRQDHPIYDFHFPL